MGDINEKYQDVLKLQVKIALLDPGEEGSDWPASVKRRNTILWDICQYMNTHPVAGEAVLYLGSILLLMEEWRRDQPRTFFIPELKPEICAVIKGNEENIKRFHSKQILWLQKEILQKAWDEEKLKHKYRKQAMGGVIKCLLAMEMDGPPELIKEIKLTLARAYLYRGMIIRPRGFSVPAKKKEALNKALGKLEVLGDSTDEEYLRLKGMIYLEKELMGDVPGDIKEVLLEILTTIHPDYTRNEDAQIILRYAEDKSHLKGIFNEAEINPFDKARAAYLLRDAKLGGHVKKAIDSLTNYGFSHPYWGRLIDLLKGIRDKKDESAKENAVQAWEVCKKSELMVANNCILRWYWSQQREIYDLAFHAADDPAQKARIADSLKGRPALRWNDLEKMAENDEGLKERLEKEAKGLQGYVKGVTGEFKVIEEEPLIDFPKPWVAINFYIEHGRIESGSQAYAMIYDSEKKGWKETENFGIHKLWKAYRVWQENYSRRKELASEYLWDLCVEAGRAMPFLFSLPKKRPVVLIPYGFLHRIPLHMAIQAENGRKRVWSADHRFTYLPSWSSFKKSALAKDGRKLLLEFFPDDDYPKYSGWEEISGKAEVGGETGQIEKLIVRCHGYAHPTNPFLSFLKLKDGQWSHQEILGASLNLSGAKVFLGACETDLVPPTGSPVDEHLSISNAFIQKGAVEVLGSLWEIKKALIEDFSNVFVDSSALESLSEVLWDWLSRNFFCRTSMNSVDLFDYAAFRTIGLPFAALPK